MARPYCDVCLVNDVMFSHNGADRPESKDGKYVSLSLPDSSIGVKLLSTMAGLLNVIGNIMQHLNA